MKIYIDKPHSLIQQGQRANQEDCIYPKLGKATSDDRFFILCDGMGGHDSGEVASSTVCERMSQWIRENITDDRPITKEIVIAALDAAYDGLDEKDDPAALKKMGTTMTFVMFHRAGCTVAHIGDSRVYHISPLMKSISHTQDHSLVNDLLKCGEITEDEVATSRVKNVITRAMQPHQSRRSKPDVEIIENLYPGDYFYMCSDGMLEKMSDEQIITLISDPGVSDEKKIEMLISETKDNKDNHSAHLIRISRVCNDDGTDIALPNPQDVEGVVEIEEKDASHFEVTTPIQSADPASKEAETNATGGTGETTPQGVDVKVTGNNLPATHCKLPVYLPKSSTFDHKRIIRYALYGILIFASAYLLGRLFFFLRDHSYEDLLTKIMQLIGDK